MPLPNAITAAFLDSILLFLAPLFLAATGDMDRAKQAAHAILGSYEPRTNRELRLVALSIAFSLGALDSVSRSHAPDLTDIQVTRWRANGNALSRSAAQHELRFDRLRKPGPIPAVGKAESLPAGTATEDLLAFVRSAATSLIGDTKATAAPQAQSVPLSRQQRRRLELEANQKRQREEELARRAARLAAHRNGGQVPASATA